MSAVSQVSIKVIGDNGQISLGAQYSGREVLVEEQEPGVWLVRIVTVIPDTAPTRHQLLTVVEPQHELSWSQDHAASEGNMGIMQDTINLFST
jgi:hypothetical protein